MVAILTIFRKFDFGISLYYNSISSTFVTKRLINNIQVIVIMHVYHDSGGCGLNSSSTTLWKRRRILRCPRHESPFDDGIQGGVAEHGRPHRRQPIAPAGTGRGVGCLVTRPEAARICLQLDRSTTEPGWKSNVDELHPASQVTETMHTSVLVPVMEFLQVLLQNMCPGSGLDDTFESDATASHLPPCCLYHMRRQFRTSLSPLQYDVLSV